MALPVTETVGSKKKEQKSLETGQDCEKKDENVKEKKKKPIEKENQKPKQETPALAPEVENPPIVGTEKVKLREKQFEIIQKSADMWIVCRFSVFVS